MSSAIPQINRRMGLGRGLRTCDVPQNRLSPNVGLQQQNASSAENTDPEPVQSNNLEADFERVVPQKSPETLHVPLCMSENPPETETASNLGAEMYYRDAHHQNGVEGPLVGLLVDLSRKPTSTKKVACAVDAYEHPDYVGTPFQSSPRILNARDIERGILEKSKLEPPSPQYHSQRFPDKRAQELWKERCARFLRPALLQAQTASRQIPPEIAGENLTNAPVSSAMGSLREMNGSIPTQRIPSNPAHLTNSNAIPPGRTPARNPVFIKPLPDISTIQVTKIPNGTAKKVSRTASDPTGKKGVVGTVLRGRTFSGSPEQECIKKQRCYTVGDWKSFLVKNFSSSTHDGSFAIWITESETNSDLEERLAKIDERRLQILHYHRLGGAALLKRSGKYLRVMIMYLHHCDATVEDVDSGDMIEVETAELYCLPQVLKAIPPLALKVIVEADRITNAKRFETALQLAKQHQTVTDGCALTWDFVPKFLFRLPGCRTYAVTKTPISTQWREGGVFNLPTKQKLYKDLPEVVLPAAGKVVKDCLITHVEGSTVYITYEELHNFLLVPVTEDLTLAYEIGNMCLVSPDWNPTSPSSQMRCCIEAVKDQTAMVRWIDSGSLLEVPKHFLLPLPASLVYPPGTVKANLASFRPEHLECIGDALSRVLLSLVSSQVIFLTSKSVPEVLIFTDDFIEVKPESLHRLEALVNKEDTEEEELAGTEGLETQETEVIQEQPQEATVVGIAAFKQVWVVPKELMSALEDMEARLTRSKPPLLEDGLPDTPCAVMHDNVLRRGLIRLRIGKRFLVRLVDRAMEISATRVFELPQEYCDLQSPSYRIALCREQIKDAHFGRFISALKMHPDVILLPVSSQIEASPITDSSSDTESVTQSGHDTPTYFLTTPDGKDIISAYGIRHQAQREFLHS